MDKVPFHAKLLQDFRSIQVIRLGLIPSEPSSTARILGLNEVADMRRQFLRSDRERRGSLALCGGESTTFDLEHPFIEAKVCDRSEAFGFGFVLRAEAAPFLVTPRSLDEMQGHPAPVVPNAFAFEEMVSGSHFLHASLCTTVVAHSPKLSG